MKLASGESLKITFGTVLLKAVAEALLAAPRLNAFLRYNAFAIRGKLSVQRHVNVTLPWLLADGKVVTVVVPRAEEASIVELQSYVNRLAERIGNSNMHEVLNRTATHDTIHKLKTGQMAGFARLVSVLLGLTRFTRLKGKERRKYYARDPSKRLTAKDINAGTVVISNIGSIQAGQTGRFGLIDVVAPQVFAVGISAVQERPSVVTGAGGEKTVGIRSVLPFCLVFDHRAFEFGELLPFLRRLDQLFANPSQLLPLMECAVQ